MGWWKLFAQGDKGQEAEERDNDTRHWGWPVPFTPATLSLPPVHHLRAFSLHGWGRGQAPVPRGPGLTLWPAGSQGRLSGRLAARATSGLCTAHRHTGLSVGQTFWRFGI